MKKSQIFRGLTAVFSFSGLVSIAFATDSAWRIGIYVMAMLFVILFVTLYEREATTDRVKREFQGEAICELPDGAKFEKIAQHPLAEECLGSSIHYFFLLLKRRDISGPDGHTKLYYLSKHSLLDKDGKELSKIPENFEVKKGTIGLLERLKEFHEVGKTHEVYYLIS